MIFRIVFFFNDTATTEIYTLSLHDALPISAEAVEHTVKDQSLQGSIRISFRSRDALYYCFQYGIYSQACSSARSEEHTSELQSRQYLVCRLLLEKKKIKQVIS